MSPEITERSHVPRAKESRREYKNAYEARRRRTARRAVRERNGEIFVVHRAPRAEPVPWRKTDYGRVMTQSSKKEHEQRRRDAAAGLVFDMWGTIKIADRGRDLRRIAGFLGGKEQMEIDVCEVLDKVLHTLTCREREIIKQRYGISGGHTHTLEEVGRIFKVTRQRVRQVEAKAIRKLQHPVRLKALRGLL